MGYTYTFADNETYGVDDINAAVSRLTTSGVTVCPTDGNLIAALNGVTAAMATQGVDFDSYSCLVSVENEKIKISPGTAFFEDGKCIVIDTEGAELSLEKEVYVYLFEDINQNSCYPCAAAELPESRYVLLAYINADGTVADKRTYAVSKLAPNSAVVPKSYPVTLHYSPPISQDDVLLTLDTGFSNFGNVIYKNVTYTGYTALEEGKISGYVSLWDGDYVRFRKVGQKLEFYVRTNGVVGNIYDREFNVLLF